LKEKGRILKSASVIALITVISRICGYLRDQRVVLLLGTSTAADSFVLAFRIPNLIRRLVGEGSLSACFIPVFARSLRENPSVAWDFARHLFWILALCLSVVSLLSLLFSRQVIYLFTLFGGHPANWELAVYLNRIISPYLFFLGLTALAMAVLNTRHSFALPAATTIVLNLTIIASSFSFFYRPILRWAPEPYRSPAVALALGILVGGFLQFAMQVPALLRQGMNFAPAISFSDPFVRRFGRLMAPSFFGMGVYQINFFVDTIFATSPHMPAGSITSLYVADRVMELVLGSYAIALSTALLPTMSHQMAAGKLFELKQTFAFSLRIVSFITIPAAAGLVLLRGPIIRVLFQHGAFTEASTVLTSRALLFYSLGLPAFAAIKLITPVYFSAQDTMTPALVGAWSLGMNIAFNVLFLLLFTRLLSNGSPALASSLAAYFNFAALLVIFRRRFGAVGARDLWTAFAKMFICAAVMSTLCVFAVRASHFESLPHFLWQALWLGAVISAAVAVYFGLARLVKCEELSELMLLVRRSEPVESAALRADA
jgi:putative peptidoglycan lipid II flippase